MTFHAVGKLLLSGTVALLLLVRPFERASPARPPRRSSKSMSAYDLVTASGLARLVRDLGDPSLSIDAASERLGTVREIDREPNDPLEYIHIKPRQAAVQSAVLAIEYDQGPRWIYDVGVHYETPVAFDADALRAAFGAPTLSYFSTLDARIPTWHYQVQGRGVTLRLALDLVDSVAGKTVRVQSVDVQRTRIEPPP